MTSKTLGGLPYFPGLVFATMVARVRAMRQHDRFADAFQDALTGATR